MNTTQLYFPFTAFINAVASIELALLVIYYYRKRIARYIFYFCFAVAWWSGAYLFWQLSGTAGGALFWSRMLMVGAILVPISYLHLAIVYLDKDRERKFRNILYFFYVLSFVWFVADTTPYFISGVVARSYFRFWPVIGVLFSPYLTTFFVEILLAAFLLYQKYRDSGGVERVRAGLLFVGTFVAFVGGSTNFLLMYNIPVAPWGNGLVVFYVLLIVYAILKYRFLELRIIFAELFIGLFIAIASVDLVFSKTIFELSLHVSELIILVLLGFILVRSVRREIMRREESAMLAASLEDSNRKLVQASEKINQLVSLVGEDVRTSEAIFSPGVSVPSYTTNRLKHFIDVFLNVSTLEQSPSLRVASSDVNSVIRNVLNSFFTPERSRIIWEPLSDTDDLQFDSHYLGNALEILLRNGLQYSQSKLIKLVVRREMRGLSVWVSDSGIGFERAEWPSFFQMYYRGKIAKTLNPDGVGLSLYIVRKIVEAHNGRVFAHSRGPDQGSEFGFWIPSNPETPDDF